jgi:hypothetical protein
MLSLKSEFNDALCRESIIEHKWSNNIAQMSFFTIGISSED